jgi:hypothetical protein
MKALIEVKEGLYIIRIYGKEGVLYDAYVVGEVEMKTCNQDGDLRDTLAVGTS